MAGSCAPRALSANQRLGRYTVHDCLERGGIVAGDLAAVAFYDKPLLKLDRLLETYLWLAPRGLRSFLKAGPLWGKSRLFLERAIRHGLDGYDGRLLWCEHHESHAASAFYPSPFQEAAVLTMDASRAKIDRLRNSVRIRLSLPSSFFARGIEARVHSAHARFKPGS